MLWRGPDIDGSDVDVLVAPGRTHDVARVLRDAGLSPAPQADGRVMWRSFGGEGVVIDAMPAEAWPPHHPSLEGLLERVEDAGAGLPVASAGDRLLIRAAEAVGGRPVEHVARKVKPLLGEPGAREALHRVAAAERSEVLAVLIDDLEKIAARAGEGPLPYGIAVAVASQSPLARAALRDRIGRTFGAVRRPPPPEGARPGEGLVVALSGMDGSGKSTAALELVARLAEQGRPAVVSWSRLAADSEILDLIAGPVRRVLRRGGRTAAPEATAALEGEAGDASGGAEPGSSGGPGAAGGAAGFVKSGWVAVVAGVNARASRRAARHARDGVVVVCDRWLVDALVDLDVRYGRHRAAEWILRRATPGADLAVLLDIDAETSAARKPGDQAPAVLERMAIRYAEVARELGFPAAGEPPRGGQVRIDARGDRGDVVAAIEAEVAARLKR